MQTLYYKLPNCSFYEAISISAYLPAMVPGIQNCIASTVASPQAGKAIPLPGAAEHYPPKANETVGSLAADNHRKQFGRDGWRQRVTSL